MNTATYEQRRDEVEHYFDRTAVDAWKRLTSDAPVGRIRATVRAGRDRMRETLLSYLPNDLTGRRVLDAGCGAGALAVEAAKRGADVVAIDLSPTMIDLARERQPNNLRNGSITFLAGDMLNPDLGEFDHIVAMDSFIHYNTADLIRMLSNLSERASASMVFTIAPRTPMLAAMHTVGRLFPRGNKAPSIVPVPPTKLHQLVRETSTLSSWEVGRYRRINSGFYLSMANELKRR